VRALLLGLIVLGACFVVAPVADACIPPNCPGFGDCHVRTTDMVLPTGDQERVPTGLDCYY